MTPRPHLATLLDDMRRLGAQTAVVEHRGLRRFRTSYASLAQGAAWFAAELLRRQIGPGERVVLWGENSAAWIACFFGCVMRGVLVVPLDATGTQGFAERVVRETGPRLVVGDPLLLLSVPGSAERMSLADVERRMHQAKPGANDADGLVAEGLCPDTPLQILFTSGTTGEPKGIVHTHRNLLASLTPIEREIEKYRRYERWVHPLHFLHTLPLSHVFGQFMGLWVAPALGAVVHYESRLEAGRLLRLLKRERISVLAAVPRVLSLLRTELLTAHPQLTAQLVAVQHRPIARRWWRLRRVHRQLGYRFWAIVCGGATLPQELETFWTTLGTALIQGYGMTETSALVTLNHPFKPARGTLGAPLPGRELRIAGNGELLVRGEMVATSVWENGGLRENSPENDGWLATGDLTRRDEQGRLHYLGRTGQRLVTSAGLNVYLEDIEAALAAQKGVHAAVALAIDGAQGPEPAAVLIAGELSVAAQAVAQANAGLAQYQRVGRWWIWPGLDLPRTATGKVRRGVIEAWVGARLLDEEDPGQHSGTGKPFGTEDRVRAQRDLLLDLIVSATGVKIHALNEPTTREELSLESLGVDSLGRLQLQASIERASGRSIDDAQMAAVRTLGDLRRLSAGVDEEASPGEPLAMNRSENKPGVARNPEANASRDTQAATRAASWELPHNKIFLYLRWPWAFPVQLLRTVFLEACVHPLVWLLAAPKVELCNSQGNAALALNTPFLIVANHVSTYDVPLLLYALPAPLRTHVAVAVLGEMLEDWRHARGNPLGPAIYWLLTTLFNVFPLPRSHAFRRAFLHAGEALDRGYSVLVFPEGARSHGGPIQPFRGGIGLLAQGASAPVLPIALRQSRRPANLSSLRPFAVTVRIGDPIMIGAAEDARTITRQLEDAVRELLDPSSPEPSKDTQS